MMAKTIYAEDVNYWQSGKSSPDTWVDNAEKLILDTGKLLGVKASIDGRAFGTFNGQSGYVLAFTLGVDSFRVQWPVLKSRGNNIVAARRQAATMLFHDIKSKCVTARVFGPRTAFFQYLTLPDGRTAADLSSPELTGKLPELFSGPPQLVAGEIVD